jgi:hypothetical protein
MPDEPLAYFGVLRERLKSGLRRVMEIDRKEPHFVAALIMAVGCEAVGKLLEGVDGTKRETHEVFVDELVLPHRTLNRAMARDLFQSIRHGIAHRFRPKPIVLRDGRYLWVTLNWGEAPEHLGLRTDQPGVWVNLPTMQADFEAMLDKYHARLASSSKPGRKLTGHWWRESIQQATKESEPGWRAFLEEEA